MKKGVFLFIIAIINLKLVLAQDFISDNINVLMVIFPLALIGLGLLFFLFIYLRDNYKNIFNFKIKLPFKKKEKKEKYKTDVKSKLTRRIKDFQSQYKNLTKEEVLDNLSDLTNDFIKEKLNIDYVFTHDEIAPILKNKKQEWYKLSEKINELRYSGKEVSQKELDSVVKEFSSIVKSKLPSEPEKLPVHKEIQKKTIKFEISILDKLKHYLKRSSKEPLQKEKIQRSKKIKEIQNILETKNIEPAKPLFFEKIENNISNFVRKELNIVKNTKNYIRRRLTKSRENQFLETIEEGLKFTRKKDIVNAKLSYQKALKIYYKLPLETEEEIANRLTELYEKIEEASELLEKEEISLITRNIEQLKKNSYVLPEKTNSLEQKFNNALTYAQTLEKQSVENIRVSYYHLAQKIHDIFHHTEKIVEKEKPINAHQKEFFKKVKELKDHSEKIAHKHRHKHLHLFSKIKEIEPHLEEKEKAMVKKTKKSYHHIIKDFKKLINNVKEAEKKEMGIISEKISELGLFLQKEEKSILKHFKRKHKKKIKELSKDIKENKDIAKIFTNIKEIHPAIEDVEKKQIKPEEHHHFDLIQSVRKLIDDIKQTEQKDVEILKLKEKHFVTRAKEIVNNVENIEIKNAKKFSEKEKEFLSKIKAHLTPEPIIQKPKIIPKKEVFKFDLPVMKETKLNTIDKLEQFLESFKDKEKISMYDLKLKEVIFLNKARDLVRKIKVSNSKIGFKLKREELEFLDNLKELVEKIELKEAELMDKIHAHKKPMLSKHTSRPVIKPFIQQQDRISFVKEMQNMGMTIVNDTIPLEREINVPKPRYISIPKWPTIEEFKVVNKKDDKKLQELTQEENQIIYKMTEADKIKMAELSPPLKRIQKKHIEQKNWQLAVNELKNKKQSEIEMLKQEEELLRNKISSLKPNRIREETVTRKVNLKEEKPEIELKVKKIENKKPLSLLKLNKEQQEILEKLSNL